VCDDHAANPAEVHRTDISRRTVLSGAVAAGMAAAGAMAVGGCTGQPSRPPLRAPSRDTAIDGLSAYSMAMHVHSSFSEQDGSMDSQLYQATKNAVDVLWWTDHDARMEGLQYCQAVNFTNLTGRRGAGELLQGKAWHWQRRTSGPLAHSSGGELVASPVSPNDPARQGSLRLTAQSTSGQPASFGYYANSQPAGWNYRDNLTGQSLRLDVLLTPGWREGYLELLIHTSYHTATGGRPAGNYSLSYRFVPAGVAPRRATQGNTGVITIPVMRSGGGPWYTAVITPADDIAALWPDVDHRDFALWELTLSAVSTGQEVGGYFGYLRFDRTKSGATFLAQQRHMGARLAAKYPKVDQRQGLEVSWRTPHMNWFAESVTMPDYQGIAPGDYSRFLEHTVVPHVHAIGGLISYNHPFGTSFVGKLRPAAKQHAMLRKVTATMLPAAASPAALGADLLEVGYRNREGVDLKHHIALWDILSRNGAFLTGLGANDDHWGQNWHGLHNNWFTSVWAKSTSTRALLRALAAGRAWSASLSAYRGSLDLLADGSAPMGSVSVSSVTSRRLAAYATHIPDGGSLQVLQGDVDYPGHADISVKRKVIGKYAAADLARGGVMQRVDTSSSSFVRSQVVDSSGKIVALSNPIWLLRTPPPHGVPPHRGA
jgi:hypothetical protein